jgi:ABC-type transporter lipoprotein component MlaA
VSNVIQNLDEPQWAANHLLQRRPGGALKAAARFVINSTVGVAGLFDVANKVGLKRQKADFGQTLASYGVKSGPYIYVPLAGPSSLRDVFGTVVDGYFWPVHWLSLGAWQQQAVEVAHSSLEHVRPPGQGVAAPTQMAAARPADAYLAVRTAYQASLPQNTFASPARQLAAVQRKPKASPPQTTQIAANPSRPLVAVKHAAAKAPPAQTTEIAANP